MALTTNSSRQHQRGLPIVSPLAAVTSSTTPGAADKVESRPAVDQGLPQALADLTNAKKPLGGKRLRQRLLVVTPTGAQDRRRGGHVQGHREERTAGGWRGCDCDCDAKERAATEERGATAQEAAAGTVGDRR